MANSKIIINFFDVPVENEELNIYESHLGINLNEVFKEQRLTSYQAGIPNFVPEDGIHPDRFIGYISNYYKAAFDLDYNSSSLFTITKTNGSANSGTGTVTIEANYPGANFSYSVKPDSAFISIINESAPTPITIDSVVFSQASSPNSDARMTVETSVLATKIISPINLTGNTFNPFFFDVLRGQSFNLVVENAEGQQSSQMVTAPSILNANDFPISINNSPNGATVTITPPTNLIGLVFEYSLNGSDWQSLNIFSGLDIGNYTLYVRDQLGASFTKSFEVVEFGIYTPYFYISKSNSIRFANRITWGDAANYKNDENTLGAEVDVDLAYNGCQNFKSANVITTQFKSNYSSNAVTVIKEDQSEVDVPVIKKTANIGIKDKRDARKYDLGNGKTGIYFTSGNIYDYNTNAVLSQHYLAGTLPDWAIVGGYIVISNAWFTIEEIFYDEDKSADVIVVSQIYTGADVAEVVGSIYNDFNYEVYEFTIDMVNYLNETIQVRINVDDDNFESIEHISEKIDVAVNFPKNIEIQYWNDDNTDVFYATGIRHLINVELTKQEGVTEEDNDTYKTDTTAMLLSAQLYELDKFIFEPVSKEIWRKLMIALSHKNVFINGVQYVKNGSFETEGPLDKSNLYVLKATMIKTGIVYNSDSADGSDFNTGSLEIPGLIETEIGFVKYI